MKIRVTCHCCGTPFLVSENILKKGFGKFCKRKCEAASRPGNKPVERTCLQCGKKFMKPHWDVYKTKSRGGTFCSRACTDQFKRKLRKRGEQEMFTQWQKREWKEDQCVRCGSTEKLELDHKIPRFSGGKATKENAQTLCRSCNRKKFWTEDYSLYEQLLNERLQQA